MKILVVDDDDARAKSLVAHLLERKFIESDISVASCVSTARQQLRDRYFDALILDVVLPKRPGDPHSPDNGLALLDQLNRNSHLNKPERIVGITAHIDDIASFRTHFEASCHVIVEAKAGDADWREKIARSLGYTHSSKMVRGVIMNSTSVITIHGIRTNGSWQTKLRNAIEKHTDQVKFYDYKYGYFSALRMLIPSLRDKEVTRLQTHISQVEAQPQDSHAMIFAHSFGSYLAVALLKRLVESGQALPRTTLILCGSVLPIDMNWDFLPENVSIVNECGDADLPLLFSSALVPGLGMAGRCGFAGFNRDNFMNRYHKGGHSLYFDDDFVRTNWLPLFEASPRIAAIDNRGLSSFLGVVVESVARTLDRMKRMLFTAHWASR